MHRIHHINIIDRIKSATVLAAIAVLLSVMTIIALTTNASYAYTASEGGNVSYNCSVTQVNAGDEVRLVVSTEKMSICTFIAYVEYDSSLLEYQGYEGSIAGKEDGAYLVRDTDGKGKYTQVSVEQGDTGDVVGMYMIGTSERTFEASDPLVILIFKAKTGGKVSEKTFTTAETSDGTDGYTSESIRQANEATDAGDDSSGNTDSTKENTSQTNKNSGIVLIFVVAGVVILAAIVILLVVRKKR